MNTTEDLAFVAWMDEQADLADLADREMHEAWSATRLEDDPEADVSEEAFADYMESLVPGDA
jgi:hypothetical protein